MDPIAHPSLFFRKAGENDESTSLGSFLSKIVTSYYFSYFL
jgi:hypothetical protein